MTRVLPAAALRAAVARLFAAAGIPAPAAADVAEDLVAADIEGVASHGVMLVPMYLQRLRRGSVTAATEARVVSRQGGAVVLDAGHMLGQLSARQAVALATRAAAEHGLGAVALRNAFHIGALAPYARRMADAGCIGLVTTNTRPLMPATGGAEPVTGNNPIALAVPTDGPFHAEVDMALSAAAMGKICNAAAAGHPIPEGWASDAEGRPTTDPGQAIAGMLLPAAGPKGFGLAMLLELVAGGLSEGAMGAEVRGLYADPALPYGCAAFFLAIDVAHFTDPGALAARSRARLDDVARSRRAPGVARVLAPGELAHAARPASGGSCPLAAPTLAALHACAAEIGADLSDLLPA